MFEAGLTNEDSWYERLKRSWNGTILREEEVPTAWQTTNGMWVTGRPDIVLCDLAGVKKVGIELKLCCSPYTAKDVHHKLAPKREHLSQACHYMWQLDIPFKLVYTSRVDYPCYTDGPDVVYGKYGKPFKLSQFVREYDLELRDGTLYYKTEGLKDWVKTLITVPGIQAYYEKQSRIDETGDIGPRPQAIDAVGNKAYLPCQYCPFLDECNKYEHDKDAWLDAATLKANNIGD
jgi:hypothetical protein